MTSISPIIDHVGIVVSDADEAARGWQSVADFRVWGEWVAEGPQVRLVFLGPVVGADVHPLPGLPDLPVTSLQLVQPIGPGPVADFLAEHGEGVHHVCLRTHDLAAALSSVSQDHRPIFPGAYDLPCAFLDNGPNQTLVELVERR